PPELIDPTAAEAEAAERIAGGDLQGAVNAFVSRTSLNLFSAFAQKLFRPALNGFRTTLTAGGKIARKYITQQEPDLTNHRQNILEDLHKHGKFSGSFGSVTHDGLPLIMSKLIADP